jgi:cytoskeletal protein CcmA (bactofilin family)
MSEAMQSGQGRKTLVEEGTSFKGSLTSNCPVEVKGKVEGDVTAPALAVSSSGSVHGKVKVGEMQSNGELAGEFDADLVRLSGSVKDNTVIRAKSLEVKLAPTAGKLQVIFGECSLEVGEPRAEVAASRPEGGKGEKASKGSSVPPSEQTNKAASVPPAGANGA